MNKSTFKFDLNTQIATARRRLNNNVEGVSISVPFLSFRVSADDLEQKVASEIVIRMKDKRVLSSKECCDSCIENSISSILKIRSLIVDKKVALFKATDGALYMYLELMGESIKQFLTYKEKLDKADDLILIISTNSPLDRSNEKREDCFAALEMLRNHLCCCLREICRIAKMEPPNFIEDETHGRTWRLEDYQAFPAFNP